MLGVHSQLGEIWVSALFINQIISIKWHLYCKLRWGKVKGRECNLTPCSVPCEQVV
jgi:hypothetical protein